WKFDAGVGTIAPDWSGHGNHGLLVEPNWLSPGWIGQSAMEFGSNSYMAIRNLVPDANETEVSVSAWIRTSDSGMQTIASFDRSDYWRFEAGDSQYAGPGLVGWEVSTDTGVVDLASQSRVDDGQWHHVAGIFDNGTMTIYIDGMPDAMAVGGSTFGIGSDRYGFVGSQSEATAFDGNRSNSPGYWMGSMDDVRIYDRALTQDDIAQVMRGDLLLAWGHQPPSGIYDIEDVPASLTWNPGDMAAQHDVYFATDEQAVQNAEAADTTGVYRGQQAGTTYTPAEPFEWGQDYFWRIDELNTDGTISRGGVRAIMVSDFRLIDDFESYTDNDTDNEAIWQHWIDGFDIPTNGSQVGYVLPPYAEQTIVNGGSQSMPFSYDNTAGVTNSQAELAVTSPRDWAAHGVRILSLWFRGYPPTVGSFTESPVGTFTMTAAGSNIGGTADEFHFAYKTLTGPGSITARVDSVLNTHDQAKAGVMIRATLDPNSAHAFACVTPGSGVGSLGRTAAAGTGFDTFQAGITAPHWVKLERDVSGNFTVSHSTNGSTWEPVELSVPTTIPMDGTVYIGLALTSRNAAETGEAKFSNVTTSGNVGPQWTNQDIGILGNAAEPLYVSITDGAGTSAVVAHDDANAATIDVWTEWVIDLQAFADQGVNLANVDKISVGLGAGSNLAAPSGSGTLFIDDIRLLRPAEEPQP
ncbi:MAG: LamG domain-containing protein, partial [Planctomycetota bacterium]